VNTFSPYVWNNWSWAYIRWVLGFACKIRYDRDPLCEHLSFVKQSSWNLLHLEANSLRRLGVSLELPRLWWAVGKFVNVHFTSTGKEERASEVRKVVERDLDWSCLLVGNSSYLNGDIGIMCGDSELHKQITVFILWFASLCSCSPNCLSNLLSYLIL
jgi:hypothetical protein